MDLINISFELKKDGNSICKKFGCFKYILYDVIVIEYEYLNYLIFSTCNFTLRMEDNICVLSNNNHFIIEISFDEPSYIEIFVDEFSLLSKNTLSDHLYLCKCFRSINICDKLCNDGQNENIFILEEIGYRSLYARCVRGCNKCILYRSKSKHDISIYDIISNDIIVSSDYDCIYKDIENKLETRRSNIFFSLFIQSLLEVTDFLVSLKENKKKEVIKQLIDLENYGIFLCLIKSYREIFIDAERKSLRSIDEIINTYLNMNVQHTKFIEFYKFFMNSDFLSYILITKDYSFFFNSLEPKINNNEEYDLCLYKDVLNTATDNYEKIFYKFCCISKKTLISFIDLDVFF